VTHPPTASLDISMVVIGSHGRCIMGLRHRLRLIAKFLDASRQDQSATSHRDGSQRSIADEFVDGGSAKAESLAGIFDR